jgi:hypothetical protein
MERESFIHVLQSITCKLVIKHLNMRQESKRLTVTVSVVYIFYELQVSVSEI